MGQTSITVVVGSNGYMPSEQSNGHPKLCSDIYAVGMIGIFALTGVLPHQLKQDSNTLEVIWRTEAIVSDALASVLSQMVRYDFSKRYQSAAEAMHALVATERVYTSQPLLSSDPSGVMIPPPPPDSGPWMPTQLSATKSERRQLRLQVHRAMFLRTGQECYFLNLTNLSLNREIEVTHIWLESEPQVHIINYYRPLPKRLKLDEVWETWIEVEKIPISIRDNPYNLFKARLSSGKVVTSTQNKNVPSMGTVPGGPVG